MGWRTYRRAPRYQAIRYPDGRTTVTSRFSPGNWTRTTTYPNGRKAVTKSTTHSPLATFAGMAFWVMVLTMYWGARTIPVYIAATVILALWVRHQLRRNRQPNSTR